MRRVLANISIVLVISIVAISYVQKPSSIDSKLIDITVRKVLDCDEVIEHTLSYSYNHRNLNKETVLYGVKEINTMTEDEVALVTEYIKLNYLTFEIVSELTSDIDKINKSKEYIFHRENIKDILSSYRDEYKIVNELWD